MLTLTQARVLEITEMVPRYYCLLLESPPLAAEAAPGQFLHVRVREALAPLLRRPFSIAAASRDGTVTVIFRIAGEGTKIMSTLRPGDYLDCLGPLGCGFNTAAADSASLSALVAGGIGVAPLIFLAQTFAAAQKKVVLFYGAPTRSELLPVKSFLPAPVEIHTATDDGSGGFAGPVTALFAASLKNGWQPGAVFACGPHPMLQALVAENQGGNFTLQLSLEGRMACGIGACHGCAVKIGRGDETGYRLLCRDGPVFNAREVVW